MIGYQSKPDILTCHKVDCGLYDAFISLRPASLILGSSSGLHSTQSTANLSPVHTGDKVEFNTVDFIESRPCSFGPNRKDV